MIELYGQSAVVTPDYRKATKVLLLAGYPLRVNSNLSLKHLPRRSSKNCDLQFANSDRHICLLIVIIVVAIIIIAINFAISIAIIIIIAIIISSSIAL